MSRTLSAAGEEFTKEHESYTLVPHFDPVAKVWDIGYGHRFKPGEPRVPITIPERDALFHIDSLYYANEVDRLVRIDLTVFQFDALVDFAYNCGWQALAGSAKLLPAVNAGRHDAAVVAMLEWNRSRGKKVRGVCNRRYDQAVLYAYGDYSVV